MKQIKLKTFFLLPLVVFSLSFCSDNKTNPASYEFANIRRGTLERTVSASGTINPVATVRVLPRMSGKVERVFVDYNDINNKQLFQKVASHAGSAALLGMAVGGGLKVAEAVFNGEEIDGGEVVKTAIETGADAGVKVAAAGALKIGVEKGIVSIIPKGTPIGIITSIAVSGVEAVKTLGKVASGKLTPEEGLHEIGENTCGIVAGGLTAMKGAAIGAGLGLMLGPVGAVAGSLVGGAVGYMAGSAFGKAVFNAGKTVCKAAWGVVKSVVSGVGRAIEGFGKKLASIFS